jgi:hypothetical protein
MKKITLFLSLALSLPLLFVNAQTHQHGSWCGTEISDAWMQAFYQRDKSHLLHKSGNLDEVVIPIVYHLVGDDNGNGYYELQEVFRSHCELQELYTNANITFYIKDINYINNTSYYNGNNTYGLFQQNDPNVCNVFVVDDMSGVCGYSFVPENWDGSGWGGPNRGGIMLQKGCMNIGNTTYRHEMGHFLNLPHTFYGWEGENPPSIGANAPVSIGGVPVERADGSNCFASGDGFCDTPPDYLSDRWTCNFDRNYRDPLGNIFTVDEQNYMSYSNDGCATYLKEDQLAEVNAAAANHRPYLLTDPIPVFPSLTTVTGLLPEANTQNLNSNQVILSWESQSNAEYYHLQATRFNFNNPTIDVVLTDTFYVITNPATNSDYEWRVKPVSLTNVCTPFSPVQLFNTSRLGAAVNITNSSCVENADGSVEVVMNDPGSYSYSWSADDPIINSSIQNLNTSELTNLSPGRYYVTVVNNMGDTLYTEALVSAPDELEINISQTGTQLIAEIEGGTAPYSYIWDNGSESLTLENIVDGTYTIIVVDANGCQKTASGDFSNAATGIRDITNDLIGKILISPNPAKNEVVKIIIPSKQAEKLEIDILDISGKVLLSNQFEAKEGLNTASLSIADLSKGVYFVYVHSNKAFQTSKLVIH